MTINIIDPHLHLFDRSRGDYHWLKSENPPFWPDKSIIQHDFAIADIYDQLSKGAEKNSVQSSEQSSKKSTEKKIEIKLNGFVHIEAGFDNDKPWRELAYIESLSQDNVRTIASIDLLASSECFQAILTKLQHCPSLIGARHILDEEAYTILSSQQAQRNFASLNKINDFIFELQLPLADSDSEKVMPILSHIIEQNSQLRFIINHSGFPPEFLEGEALEGKTGTLWKNNIAALAQYNNVFIKCSGMEMINREYQMAWFSQITDYCIKQFSIRRVMIASNFPLCLLGKKTEKKRHQSSERNAAKELDEKATNKNYYDYWLAVIESSVIEQCTEDEKSALLHNNALSIYQLKEA